MSIVNYKFHKTVQIIQSNTNFNSASRIVSCIIFIVYNNVIIEYNQHYKYYFKQFFKNSQVISQLEISLYRNLDNFLILLNNIYLDNF